MNKITKAKKKTVEGETVNRKDHASDIISLIDFEQGKGAIGGDKEDNITRVRKYLNIIRKQSHDSLINAVVEEVEEIERKAKKREELGTAGESYFKGHFNCSQAFKTLLIESLNK